jgi:hypothetical protein
MEFFLPASVHESPLLCSPSLPVSQSQYRIMQHSLVTMSRVTRTFDLPGPPIVRKRRLVPGT